MTYTPEVFNQHLVMNDAQHGHLSPEMLMKLENKIIYFTERSILVKINGLTVAEYYFGKAKIKM